MRRDLADVLVCEATLDSADRTRIDSVIVSNGFISPCISPDVFDLIVGQFASPRVCSTFADHVSHVVGSCADEQVVRVDAQSDIACVADLQPIWDWPIEDFEGPSVNKFSLFPLTVSSSNNPVSALDGIPSARCSSPNPAVSCNFNLTESTFQHSIFVHEASIPKETAYA